MTAAAAPEPPAWQHDKPIVGRLLTKEVADALGWRPDEHYQLAVQPPDQMLRPRILPVAKIRSPGANIALESAVTIDGHAGMVADRIYFAPNPIDPNYLDRRVTRRGRPNRFDVTRLCAFMMDLDFKAGGVIDQAGAQDLIRRFAEVTGWYPALLVHSGHGWQPTYRIAGGELTEEFGPSDVAVLLARIHTLVATLAAELSLGVDSVFEATRLQRMPGSINGKDIGHPVPVTLLPLTRIENHPGTSVGMDLSSLISLLDSETSDAHVPVTARHLARGKAPVYADAAVSPADGWSWAPDDMRCTYLESVVAGWASDIPPARNPWLFSNAIRLACAHRLGCLTEQAWHDAVAVLVGRFRTLLTMTTQSGGPRDENPDEVSGCFDRALAYAAAKSYPELVAELGGHDPDDPFMKAAHLLPPEEGVDDVPPPSAPLHLAVDTGAVADQVTASVTSIAALAPASSSEAPPPPPSAVPPAPHGSPAPCALCGEPVPADDHGKGDPAHTWPDPGGAKGAGGMIKLARAVVGRLYTWVGHPDGRRRLTLRYLLADWWVWTPERGWDRFTATDKPFDAVVLMLRRKLEYAWITRTKNTPTGPVTQHERMTLTNHKAYIELAQAVRTVVAGGEERLGIGVQAWMSPGHTDQVARYRPLANGILDLDTRRCLPHDPDLFDASGALKLTWSADGSHPPVNARWNSFLAETWPDARVPYPPIPDPIVIVDAETQATLDGIAAASGVHAAPAAPLLEPLPVVGQAARLQEVFGYLLSGETRAQKVILLQGLPGAGKSVILQVLEGLFGDRYVAPDIEDILSPFGLWSLMNASVAVITDARLDGTGQERNRLLRRLLTIVGEDRKLVRRKFLPDWHGRLPCRFVITSNEEFDLGDTTGAFLRRVLPITFPRPVAPERVDPYLADTLRAGLPGIMDWGLDGRDKIVASGLRFSDTVEGTEMLDVMRSTGEMYVDFVRAYLQRGDNEDTVAPEDIVELYHWWAEHVHNIPPSRQLSRTALLPRIRGALATEYNGFVPPVQRLKVNGVNQPRKWRGVMLSTEGFKFLEHLRSGLP